MSIENLSRRQVQWAEYLSCFNFQIIYQLVMKNTKPETLTRRSGDLPTEGDEQYQNITTVIKQHNIMQLLADTASDQRVKPLETLWKESLAAEN